MQKTIFLLMSLCFLSYGYSCTTILVTKGASADGSVIVSCSDDDELGDQRIAYVPAKDHPKGSKRAVYPDINDYPRYVGKDRGPAYDISGYHPTKPLGYIDQVEHTYARIDSKYGIVNEHQLAIGECTDNAKFIFDANKDRLFSVAELAHIALERCKTAREAILLMGSLAEKYGYYEWGETLTIGDTEEGWVFEICSDPSGTSALWVAKKVPDGEIFVAANEFRIREVRKNDPDMLYSSNLFKVAEEQNWWNPNDKKPLDWLSSVSPGEYHHPYYSLRRVWSVQSRVNPSLNLSPWAPNGYTKQYPFSIKPQQKLSVKDVFYLYRSHYEGTEFDMTKGMAAGPFSNPSRYYGPYRPNMNIPGEKEKIEGAWERPVSAFYCGFSYIIQCRKWLPDDIGALVWIGLDQPYTTCYIPFYAGVKTLPYSFQHGNTSDFSFSTAWWAFNFVANWANLKYSYMIKDIQEKQSLLEEISLNNQIEIEKTALKIYVKDPEEAKEFLTNYCIENSNYIINHWWMLAKMLIEKYSDGYVNFPHHAEDVGYPKWWRDQVGYPNGPTTYRKKTYKK